MKKAQLPMPLRLNFECLHPNRHMFALRHEVSLILIHAITVNYKISPPTRLKSVKKAQL